MTRSRASAGRSRRRPAPNRIPRWARNDTHVTWTRDGNLFIAPVDPGASPLLTQLTDVAPAPARAAADRQPAVHSRRRREADRLCREAEGREEEDRRRAEERAASELRAPGPADGGRPDALARRHARVHRGRRARRRRRSRRSCRTTSPKPDTPRTSRRERTSATRRNAGCSAVLNLKTGKTAWADGSFAPTRSSRRGQDADPLPISPRPNGPPARRGAGASAGRCRRSPTTASCVVATARSADNKDRWHVSLDPETGKTRVVDLLHDDAWVRDGVGGGGLGCSGRRVSARQQADLVPVRTRWLDAPLHARRRRSRRPRPTQLTSGKWEVTAAELSRDGKKFYITTSEVHPGERHLYSMSARGRRANEDHVDGRLESGGDLTGRIDARAWSFLTATSRPKCS